jgi:hypothetical protein
MRLWINDHKNELAERIKKEVEKEPASEIDKDEKIDKLFTEELSKGFNMIVEKA